VISSALNQAQSILKSFIPFRQIITTFVLWQSVWKVVYMVHLQQRECRTLLTNGQHPIYFFIEANPGCIYIKFYHWENNGSMHDKGFYNSLIDDKDGHIPSLPMMFSCTALCPAPWEWHKNQGVHPKAFKSKLMPD